MNKILNQQLLFLLLIGLPLQFCLGQETLAQKTEILVAQKETDQWIAVYQQAFDANKAITDKDSMRQVNAQLAQLFLDQYIQFFDEIEEEVLTEFLAIEAAVDPLGLVFLFNIKSIVNEAKAISDKKNKIYWEMTSFFIAYGEKAQANTFLFRMYLSRAFLGYLPTFSGQVDVGASFRKAIAQIPLARNLPQSEAFNLEIQYANYLFGLEGDLEESLAAYQRALDFSAVDARNKAQAYLGIIRILTSKGDLERAADYADRVLNLKKEAKTQGWGMKLYNLLAKNALEKGDYVEAATYLEQAALEFKEKIADKNTAQNYYHYDISRHQVLQMQLKYQKKEKVDLNFEMIELASSMGHAQFEYWEALIDHARLADDKDFFRVIEKMLEQEKERKNLFFRLPQYNMVLRAKGAFYAEQGQLIKAIEQFEQAIQQLSGKSANDEMLLQFIREDQQALKIFRAKLDTEIKLYQKDSKRIKLIDIYSTALQAVALLDRMRQKLSTKGARALLLQDAPLIFEQAIWVANQLYLKDKEKDFLEEAFSFAEQNKAVFLLDALKENKAKKFANIPEEQQQKELSLAYDISYYTAELSKAEERGDSLKIQKFREYLFDKRKALEQLKVSLEEDYPRYFQLKYESAPIAFSKLQSLLQKEEMHLIEYAFTPNFLYIFSIGNGGVSLKEIKLDKNFISQLNQFYLSLTDVKQLGEKNSLEDLETIAYSLFTQLIPDRWQNELPKSLLIVPDGLLAYIPFETLVYEKRAAIRSYKELNYCLHKSRMTYAYSSTLWTESMEKKTNYFTKGVLAIAPEYHRAIEGKRNENSEWSKIRAFLPDLEGAVKEVSYLEEKFVGKFLKAVEANCKTFKEKAKNYAVIHLAMHGVVDNHNPAYSALFFSELSDSLEEDILFAYEIPSLEINAELVVLSACQTGFGKYQNGEGVVSLGRSFMYAGASSLLLTLWEVNDASGAHLMEYFYDYLSKGMAKDAALQHAKIQYLEASDDIAAHPYFWSNYVLLGNNKVLRGLEAKSIMSNKVWLITGIIFLFLAIILFWKSALKQ